LNIVDPTWGRFATRPYISIPNHKEFAI